MLAQEEILYYWQDEACRFSADNKKHSCAKVKPTIGSGSCLQNGGGEHREGARWVTIKNRAEVRYACGDGCWENARSRRRAKGRREAELGRKQALPVCPVAKAEDRDDGTTPRVRDESSGLREEAVGAGRCRITSLQHSEGRQGHRVQERHLSRSPNFVRTFQSVPILYLTTINQTSAIMAGHGAGGPRYGGAHPITVPPVRPLYRFAAVGLGASMWFFVCAA